MKKRNWLFILLIALSLAAFCGYRVFDQARTDLQPPVIHISAEPVELSVNAPEGILMQGVTAEDDISGDISGDIQGVD